MISNELKSESSSWLPALANASLAGSRDEVPENLWTVVVCHSV